MNRREFSKSRVGSIASYALFRTLFTTDAFADSVKRVTHAWLKDLHEISQDLQAGKISHGQWQTRIAELFNQVSLEELLARVDFDKLIQGFEYPDLGVNTKWVKFPQLEGVPANLAFYSKIF